MAMNKCTVFENMYLLHQLLYLYGTSEISQTIDTLSHGILFSFILHIPFTCPAPKKFSLDYYETFSLNPQGLIRCPCWGIQLYPVFTLLRYFSYLILNVYLPAHLFPLLNSEAQTVLHAPYYP